MSYETLTEVVREQRLHPGQDYVFDLADALGIETKIVKHDKATKTCYEKAEILGVEKPWWAFAAREIRK